MLRNVTFLIFIQFNKHTVMSEEQRKRTLIHASMNLAALRQYLRDKEGTLPDEEVNEVLDRMSKLIKLIEMLEK